MSFQTPVTVQAVLEGIHRKDYLLPAIQREFVWDPDQIRQLVDSLMRGYPIGSFLFWKVDAANAGDPMPAIPQMQSVFEPLGKAYAAIVGGADPVATMQATGQTIADTIAG